MITIVPDLRGGLGNQLFGIACAFSIAKQLNLSWGIELGQFSGCGQGSHPSKYYDNLFRDIPKLRPAIGPRINVHERQWTYYPELVDDVREALKTATPNSTIVLNGYFQSDRWWREFTQEVKQLFTIIPPIRLKEQNEGRCCIGVRRGDYITYKEIHNPCDRNFYDKAMEILPAVGYDFFSDDMNWCRANYQGPQFRFLENKDDFLQFVEMCSYASFVIANSTYFWWSSFLSICDNPKIVVPDRWIFGPNVRREQYSSIYRPEMTVVEREIATT